MGAQDDLDYRKPEQYSRAEESNGTFIPKHRLTVDKDTVKYIGMATPEVYLKVSEDGTYEFSTPVDKALKDLLKIEGTPRVLAQMMMLAYECGLKGQEIPQRGRFNG